MCGIAGLIQNHAAAPETLLAMRDALRRRGPDAEHIVGWNAQGQRHDANPDVALIHTRLAIMDPRPEADATRGTQVSHFTETIDTMPTILEWLGLPVPRTCDGASLLPFLTQGHAPQGWRTEVHYEYDFRDIFYSKPQDYVGTGLDDSSLAVIQDEHFKYVHFTNAPPLFFDLKKDPGQFNNVAQDPAYQTTLLTYAQKMLSWRMRYMDRTLTGYAASPDGLQIKA